MARDYNDLLPSERELIARLLSNHAIDLNREAKKLQEELGQPAEASALRRQAAKIVRDTRPIFDDQATLDLNESDGKGSKKGKKKKDKALKLIPSKSSAKDPPQEPKPETAGAEN